MVTVWYRVPVSVDIDIESRTVRAVTVHEEGAEADDSFPVETVDSARVSSDVAQAAWDIAADTEWPAWMVSD
ncbi:MAG: hypothetical protein ACJ77A_18415 [Actinomycetota bacterium]